jgi:hypothetical protein
MPDPTVRALLLRRVDAGCWLAPTSQAAKPITGAGDTSVIWLRSTITGAPATSAPS